MWACPGWLSLSDVEALFIRAKLAQLLSPYTPEALWEVKTALENTEGLGEAAVIVQGYRIVGYIKPDQNDEQRLMDVLDGWGERQTPLSKKPGRWPAFCARCARQLRVLPLSAETNFTYLYAPSHCLSSVSDEWKFKDLGWVKPEDDKLRATTLGKTLPPHLFPSVIIGLRDFQPQNCMDVTIGQFQKHGLQVKHAHTHTHTHTCGDANSGTPRLAA